MYLLPHEFVGVLKIKTMQQFLSILKSTKTQAYLAFTILLCGFGLISFGKLTDNVSNRIFDLMFLTATFYFGSSKSGATKDETISSLANNQSNPVVNTADTVNVSQ